jgi:hypothetical protein
LGFGAAELDDGGIGRVAAALAGTHRDADQ